MKVIQYLQLLLCFACLQTASAQCSLNLTLVNTIPAKCYGTPTGGVQSSVSGAQPPVSYLLDGQIPSPQPNILNAIPAGLHYLVAKDNGGCIDTIFFTITQPPEIIITTNHTDANCNGANDGTATASAMGGNSGFTFSWQGCLGGNVLPGASVTNLYAGCYKVFVEDSNDCENTATVQIGEPAPFIVIETRDSISCFGAADGAIALNVSGGLGPYTYLWDNGQTTSKATGLTNGYHPVTITDADGCSTVYLAQAFQPVRLNIDNVIRTPPLCSSGTDGKAEAKVTGGTQPYTFAWSGGTNMGNIATNLGGGSYMVTVTDAHGCTDNFTFNITPQQQISVFTTAKTNETCLGACNGKVTLTVSGGAGPYSYQWAAPNLPQPDPNALCAGDYIVTVSDQNGCTKTHAVNIKAGNQLDISLIPTNPSCANKQDGRIISNVSGAILPISYKWSSNQTTNNLTNIACGNYAVTVTDGSGCTGAQTASLTCPPAILIDSIATVLPKCTASANGSLTAFAQGGQGMLTYKWSDMNQQTLTTAINLAAGNYTVTVTDANACTNTATETLVAPAPIVASIASTNILCFGDQTGSATVAASGGTGALNYLWNVPGNTNKLNQLPTGSYMATVTDANGCTAQTTAVQVTGPATALTATVNQTKIACFGGTNGSAKATIAGGTGPAYQILWSTGATSLSVTNLAKGTLSATITDQNGCMQTANTLIDAYEKIEANVAFSKPTCFGLTDGSAAVNNVMGGAGNGTTGAYSYQWSAPNAGNNDFVQNLASGAYTLTVTDTASCSQVLNLLLEEPKEIRVEYDKIQPICFGEKTGTLDLVQTFGENPIQSFTWSTGETTESLSDIGAGSYILSLVDTDNCTKDTTFTLEEPKILRISALSIFGLDCADDSTGTITPKVQGGTGIYTFEWNTGSVDSLLADQKAGFYWLTVTDGNGCAANDSIELSNPLGLDFNVLAEPVACFGDKNGRIRITTIGGTPPFRYSLDGQSYSGSSVFIALPAGPQDVYVQDGNGCLSKKETEINEPLEILVNLIDTVKIHLGDSLELEGIISNGQGSFLYTWYASNNKDFTCLDSDFCEKIQAKPIYENHYTLVVEDENGCRGQDRTVVIVEKSRGIYVPTGFTPNGDNANDMLCIYGKQKDIKTVHLFRVFDRWGEQVYEDRDVPVNTENRGWDGTFRGANNESGTFIWYIDVEYKDGYREVVHGQTQLIR